LWRKEPLQEKLEEGKSNSDKNRQKKSNNQLSRAGFEGKKSGFLNKANKK
jgi:hypothetical protein